MIFRHPPLTEVADTEGHYDTLKLDRGEKLHDFCRGDWQRQLFSSIFQTTLYCHFQ